MSNSPSPEQLLEHAAWLRRLAGTLVLDAARADDVTQQTLLEALQRAPARVEHSRAWLATVARNFARAIGRGERRREGIERAAARPESVPASDEVVARTAQHHQVVGAVLALAEPYRTTVLLRFFENLKPGAIAKRTEVPVETVRTRLKRGLELLRAELVERRERAAVGVRRGPGVGGARSACSRAARGRWVEASQWGERSRSRSRWWRAGRGRGDAVDVHPPGPRRREGTSLSARHRGREQRHDHIASRRRAERHSGRGRKTIQCS